MKLIRSHGFVLDHVQGSHYIFFHPKNGQRVVVPFHTRDVPRGTLHAILQQARIDITGF